jgi:hypothetical protein
MHRAQALGGAHRRRYGSLPATQAASTTTSPSAWRAMADSSEGRSSRLQLAAGFPRQLCRHPVVPSVGHRPQVQHIDAAATDDIAARNVHSTQDFRPVALTVQPVALTPMRAVDVAAHSCGAAAVVVAVPR